MRYLQGLQPCYFPKLSNPVVAEAPRSQRSLPLPFDHYAELRQLSGEDGSYASQSSCTPHGLWCCASTPGLDDVCFGYVTADRDAPVQNLRRTVGAFINMLCCRIQISSGPMQTLEDIFRAAQEQHLESLEFQRCSLARVQHDLGLGGSKILYNTATSTQNHSGIRVGESEGEDGVLLRQRRRMTRAR